MKNKLLVFFILISYAVCAQQEMQFSQFMLNQASYNPGFTGTDNALSAAFQYRNQWTGLPGHPILENFNVHTPINFWNCGAGLFMNNEVDGALRNTEAEVAFCKINRIKKATLNVGVRAGVIQSSLDGDKLRAPDGDYSNGAINHNDNILPTTMVSSLSPDVSAGMSFRSKKFEAGISALHLLGSVQKFKVSNTLLTYNIERTYQLYASGIFSAGKKSFIRPSLFLKYESPELQTEANILFIYKKFIWLGAGYRGFLSTTTDGLIAYAGIYLNPNITLGYSYDYSISPLKSANNGSHEIILNYHLSLTRPYKPGKFIFTPRF